MSQSLLFSISCSWRLPSGAVEEAQVPSLNSVRLRPSAHRCSCSRNPPIPASPRPTSDNARPFGIAQLSDDAARVIEMLGFERASVLGWSLGGFIAQTLAFNDPTRVHKLILLSTDPGGTAAELASPAILGQLTDTSGTPHEQARRLIVVLFPGDLAASIYREFGDVVAAARAKLARNLVDRQAAAMDAWHHNGAGDRLRELSAPTLVATGTEDVVIPASNAVALINVIPDAWLAQFKGGGHAFMAQYPASLADLINEFLAL